MQDQRPQRAEKVPTPPRRATITVAEMIESIVGCKWSMRVLAMVRAGTNRPGAMVRAVDGLTTKVLNERLRKLVRFGIARKVVHPVAPPHVEYQLTEFGQRFGVLIDEIERLESTLESPTKPSQAKAAPRRAKTAPPKST